MSALRSGTMKPERQRLGGMAIAAALCGCLLAMPAGAASRTTEYSYRDDLSGWVLGQTAGERDTGTGAWVSQVNYDPATSLPAQRYAFGRLEAAFSYHADGNVATVVDGAGNLTRVIQWYRGQPTRIEYADGTSVSATVSEAGLILSAVDEAGAEMRYGYDPMGRVTRIEYPAGDSVGWAQLNAEFRPLTAADAKPGGIVDGQWRRLEWRGNYRKASYFDALWRPLLVVEHDESDVAGTQRSTAYRYNREGRMTFASYPVASGAGGSTGSWTEYDVLGRVTSTSQDSELGLLTTTTTYRGDGGYNALSRDPKGQQTRTWYQTFDEPSSDRPVVVEAPDGTRTEMPRDVFGKPIQLQRIDSGVASVP